VLPIGSELWLLYFDAPGNRYVARYEGTISRVLADRYFAGGKWHQPGHPHFSSDAEAKAWIEKHPFSAPSIK
jgi:hypothetical protein